MKSTLIRTAALRRMLLLLGMILLFPVASATSLAAEQELETLTMEVEGMTCKSCPRKVRAILHRIDGVEEAHVTFTPPHARVSFDPSQTGSTVIRDTLSEMGYPAAILEQSNPDSRSVE